ncbi:MAG: hypothetical protein JOZ84_11930 [Methylobacteriaceae bacterium]|nr:hypothetical protein [Methylobacteriaceae bacterium]
MLEFCEEGEDSVGVNVCVDHLAPCLAGAGVEIVVTVVKVDGRRISFEVSARDERHVRLLPGCFR